MKKGTFTIQFAIIFPIMLMVVLTSIDISSIAYHYNCANRAVNMASFSALSNFNYDLKERYGVFGVDTKSLNENVKFYVQENYCDNKDDEDKVKVKVSANANNDKNAVIRQLDNQIMAFTKYRVPLTAIKIFISKLDFLKKSEHVNDAADEMVDLISDRGEESLNQYYKDVEALKMNINYMESEDGKAYESLAKSLNPNEKVIEAPEGSLKQDMGALNGGHTASYNTVSPVVKDIDNLPKVSAAVLPKDNEGDSAEVSEKDLSKISANDLPKVSDNVEKVYQFATNDVNGECFNITSDPKDVSSQRTKLGLFEKNVTNLENRLSAARNLHNDISKNRKVIIKKYEDQIEKIRNNPNIKEEGKKEFIGPLEDVVNNLKTEALNNDGENGKVSLDLDTVQDEYITSHKAQFHVIGIDKLDELETNISNTISQYQKGIKDLEYQKKLIESVGIPKLETDLTKLNEDLDELKKDKTASKEAIDDKEKEINDKKQELNVYNESVKKIPGIIKDYESKKEKLNTAKGKVSDYKSFVNGINSPYVKKYNGTGSQTPTPPKVELNNFQSEEYEDKTSVSEGSLSVGNLKADKLTDFDTFKEVIDNIKEWLDVKKKIGSILGEDLFTFDAKDSKIPFDIASDKLVSIDLSNLTGGKNLFSLDGINGLVKNIYLNEYIVMTFSSAVTGKGKFTGNNSRNKNLRFANKEGVKNKTSNYSAQIEYIVVGNDKDITNIGNCCLKILLIRMIPNCAYVVMKHTSKLWSIAGLTGPFAPLTYALLVGIWAGAESLYDLMQLLQGEGSAFLNLRTGDFALDSIAFIKDKLLPLLGKKINNIVVDKAEDVAGEFLDDTVGQYFDDVNFEMPGKIKSNNYADFDKDPSLMTYEDYLRIFLLMANRDVKLKRIANLYALDGYDIVNDYSNNVTVEADFELDLVFIPRVLVMMQKMTGVASQNIEEKYTIHIKREMAY